ncbi:type 1 glutamine amidotransferase domain-containing protein [Kutzneria sp. CA-103260]|uniref:type 1 glutamine amidotransferase domain-containing protein n=1 Tax=Kutzneria sp. CA-103260 TaxID=2802641 RepID=UPI001BA7076E|nr:type 1 glutamine amidotransferase domain-containing protein [Kutzneria sp. CA-103260]QUQ72401.1 type 1 glutamine amidotransferase domain-containing protein [Kutzneria sp. CA-103260]
MTKVLFILSGARSWSQLDGTQHPTGFWAEEFITPHRIFTAAGLDIRIATPGGRVPAADQISLNPTVGIDEAAAADFRAYLTEVKDVLDHPTRLEDINPDEYDVVLIPGGHGPMQDLAVNDDINRILGRMLPDDEKIVASVCHGQAAFLAAGDSKNWLFKGRRMTAFTDAEEQQAGLAANAPFLLESRLRAAGATYESGGLWQPFVVTDGNLITGQNPVSSAGVAETILKELAAR